MRDIEQAQLLGWKLESQRRRGSNRENGAKILSEHGISFESKNMGAHLIVNHGGAVFDFWPGTGKYTPRGSGRSGRGVFNLIRLLGIDAPTDI